MHTRDLMTKRPIETGVPYGRRIVRRYGDPLPEMAFAAGLTSVLTGLVTVDPRVGAAAAILWVIH